MGVMAVAVIVALNPRFTLWRLIELKMELLIQCAPAFLLALHLPRLRAGPLLLGVALGTVIAAGGALGGFKRLSGIHIGLIGLAANLVVVALASALWRPRPPEAGRV